MNEIPSLKLNNDIQIPSVGFGTWQLKDGKEVEAAVSEALRVGYRLIDTAKIYGNEKGVGEAISVSEVPREEIFVTTKLWNGDQGYETALRAFDASLERLGLNYIDLYLIHWPGGSDRKAAWRALCEIYKSGRAKAIGVSNYTVRHLEELLASSDVIPTVNQVEFHPFLYDTQKPLLEFCAKNKIIVEAYSPLAHAHRMNDPVLSDTAGRLGKTNAQVMLRWCVQHGTVPIPKSTNPSRIKENLDVFDFEISAKDMEDINALSQNLRTTWNPENMP